MKITHESCWIIGLFTMATVSACSDDELAADRPPGGAAGSSGAGQYGAAGTSGTVGLPCDSADPLVAEDDAAHLFDYPHVPRFDLYLPEEQWQNLQRDARDEQFVPVQGCFEGKSIGQIGLRFKGSEASLYSCFDETGKMICPRLSMKLKFNEYDSTGRFYGLKRLDFHAYRYDDTRLKQRLTSDLFLAMGVPTSRAAWAVVRVNGKTQGLYGMVEEVDGHFAADHWPNAPDGNLYKEVWPTQTDPNQIIAGLKTNEDVADVSAFQAFAQAMTTASDDQLRSTLGSYADLDYLARYMAVDDATANYDGITYFWTDGVSTGNHNYFFYEQSPARFYLIPWDFEGTLWINPHHAAPHWTVPAGDCSVTYPYWSGVAKAPACDPFVRAMAADLSGWRRAGRELLDGPFAEDRMKATIDRYADFIRAEVEADPTPLTYGTFDGSVVYMRNQIAGLRARFEKLLAEAP
jgi:spore coat protein H